jgi:hypothetical protein
MPEIKKTFLRGRMNKDLDERLMPDGEYRDALNIQISSTEESDAGTAQNIRGNKILKDLSATSLFGANAKCVGKIADEENDKIYWFVKGTSKQGIIEYNTSTDTTKPLVIDLTGAVLNFSDNEITGIVIIDKNLAWTDNNSEPKIIDIDDFVTYNTYTAATDAIAYGQTTERAAGVDITEADITVIKKKPIAAPTAAITKHTSDPSDKSLFEDKFVRFAYRWKFKNSQYSVISPFTNPLFEPDTSKGYDLEEGYNNRMLNYISQITLTGFDITPSGLESIDLLYKESNNTNIYIYKTVTNLTDLAANGITIQKESVYSVVPENQLIRQYDNVPYRANALEIVGNRLVFGNYVDGLDLGDYNPNFNQSSGATEFVPKTGTDIKTIKSNRTYQLGIAFEDQYGRQSPVISDDSGLIKRAATGGAPVGLQIKMGGTKPPDTNNRITHYKYYIKDSSSEYYNLIVDRAYEDTQDSNFIWIAFPSYEINKIKEDDEIILKRTGTNQIASSVSGYTLADATFKILDISESAPVNTAIDEKKRGVFYAKIKKNSFITTNLLNTSGAGGFSSIIEPSDANSAPSGALYLGYNDYYGERYSYYYKNGEIYEISSQTSESSAGGDLPNSGNISQTIAAHNVSNCSLSGNTENWYRASLDAQTTQAELTNAGVSEIFYQISGPAIRQAFICYGSSSASTSPLPAIFETVPDENILDIYYEISDSIPIANYADSTPDIINWYNAFDFADGVESNRIKDDFNEEFISTQVKASTTIDSPFKQKTNKSGLIYSGLYNSRNGINNLNQFNTGEKITKELNTEYGSIQKLHARDTDLIAFCEDKVLKILANKDALFNADGNVNLVSTNNVLGQAVPYAGEFGISKDPESFATNGNRIYFADKARNSVLRLSRDGLTVISNKGMKSYFRSKINAQALPIVGTYDAYSDQYIISFDNSDVDKIESVSFKEDVDGWVSRLGFVIKAGLSINGELYSFNSGNLYQHHHPGVVRNLFYGIQNSSGIQVIMNNEPSVVKNFKTISYEGTKSKTSTIKGWKVDTIETDLQSGKIVNFTNKEGKWFSNISGIETTLDNLDSKEFSTQGLGRLSSYSAPNLPPTVSLQPTFSSVTESSLTAQASFINPSGLTVTYKIYFGTSSTYTSNALTSIQTSPNTSFTPTYQAQGLTSNTTYYATFVASTSEFSDVLTNTANTTTLTNCSFSLSIS